MNGLLTDLYELTMAAGYFESGKAGEKATFEFAIRRLPAHRNYIVIAGIPQIVDYLLNVSFTAEEIAYLRALPQFAQVSSAFFVSLRVLLHPRLPLHRRPLRRPRRHRPVRRRTRVRHPRPHHRSPDPGNLPAERRHLPDPDRLQSRALRHGRRRASRGGVRDAPRAHSRSRHAGRAGRLAGRLRRHQQHARRIPLRHPGDGHRRPFLGHVLPLRDRRLPQTPARPRPVHPPPPAPLPNPPAPPRPPPRPPDPPHGPGGGPPPRRHSRRPDVGSPSG